MALTVVSFGFKYGLPQEADLVLDVRCLPNPFYVPELKDKTGLDQEVVDYVMPLPESQELLRRIEHAGIRPAAVRQGGQKPADDRGGLHRRQAPLHHLCTQDRRVREKLGYQPSVQHRDAKRTL